MRISDWSSDVCSSDLARIMKPEDADAAWTLIAEQTAILEGFVRFDREFSVILARSDDGEVRFWACPENVHRDGILSLSTVRAGQLFPSQADEAKALAGQVDDGLYYGTEETTSRV